MWEQSSEDKTHLSLPSCKTLFSVSPQTCSTGSGAGHLWKLANPRLCPVMDHTTCLLKCTRQSFKQQRDLLSVLSCLVLGGGSILKVYFEVCKGSCPYNSKAQKHLSPHGLGRQLMGSVPIRTKSPASNGKHWPEKEDWLARSLLSSCYIYLFFFQNCVHCQLEFRLWSMDAHWSHVHPLVTNAAGVITPLIVMWPHQHLWTLPCADFET